MSHAEQDCAAAAAAPLHRAPAAPVRLRAPLAYRLPATPGPSPPGQTAVRPDPPPARPAPPPPGQTAVRPDPPPVRPAPPPPGPAAGLRGALALVQQRLPGQKPRASAPQLGRPLQEKCLLPVKEEKELVDTASIEVVSLRKAVTKGRQKASARMSRASTIWPGSLNPRAQSTSGWRVRGLRGEPWTEAEEVACFRLKCEVLQAKLEESQGGSDPPLLLG